MKKIIINNQKFNILKESLEYHHVSDATQDKYVMEDEINLPPINIGDEVKFGKFKNQKATINGSFTNDKNQPMVKTNKGNKKVFNFDFKNIEENLELEVDSQDINLKSFEPKKKLNPKIFPNDKLNSRVRLNLLDIADDFIKELNVSWVEPEDIVIVGSIVGYDWSKYSDIDLHIIMDFAKISDNKDLVKNYFDTKKNEWNQNNENLKIYGYPVEVYVEDINDTTETNGKYSIETDEWLKFPDMNPNPELNKILIKDKSAQIMTLIDNYEEQYQEKKDLENLYLKVQKLWNKIKGMRKRGIERDGQTSYENIIFKVLRRSEYLQKLWELKQNLYSYNNSLR